MQLTEKLILHSCHWVFSGCAIQKIRNINKIWSNFKTFHCIYLKVNSFKFSGYFSLYFKIKIIRPSLIYLECGLLCVFFTTLSLSLYIRIYKSVKESFLHSYFKWYFFRKKYLLFKRIQIYEWNVIIFKK